MSLAIPKVPVVRLAAIALLGAACGTSPAAKSTVTEGGVSGAGGNSLNGTYAFPVQSAVVGAGGDCGYGDIATGGYAAFEILLRRCRARSTRRRARGCSAPHGR